MKILTTSILSCGVLCAATAWAVLGFDSDRNSEDVEGPAASLVDPQLIEMIASLKSGQDAFVSRLNELERRGAELAKTVAAYEEARTEDEVSGPVLMGEVIVDRTDDVVDEEASAEEQLWFDEKMATLVDTDSGWSSKQKAWDELKKKGLVDDALAFFEQRAEENPGNADFRAELGNAYIQKLFTVPPGPSQLKWSMKADGQYDKALAVNDQHWDARFSKAINYSFLPPLFGKQGKAIENFEILMKQQEDQPREGRFAKTYLLLGNIFSSQGKPEKAQQIWGRGAALHPDHMELASRLRGARRE